MTAEYTVIAYTVIARSAKARRSNLSPPRARALLEKAASGDTAAITALADRLDGKVPQAIGQADELGPQRLEISWRGAEPARQVDQQPVLELAAPQPEGDGQ